MRLILLSERHPFGFTEEHMKPGEDSGRGEGRNWRGDLIIYF